MDYAGLTGFTAGKIYEVVCAAGGSATETRVKKKITDPTFEYAIGWLLRENKIWIEQKGKTKKIHIV